MDSFSDVISLIALVLTALATAVLGWFTAVLARETKRLADAGSQAHVVATVEQNIWAFSFADLRVDNTGNATAYDIEIAFDPPLKRHERDAELPSPFRKVSVLRPGGAIRSFVGEFQELGNDVYAVTVSWRRAPDAKDRESYRYSLSMKDFDGIAQLGEASPLTQIAREVKGIRDDWHWITSGSRKLKVDAFTSADRDEDKQKIKQLRAEHRARQAQTTAPKEPHP